MNNVLSNLRNRAEIIKHETEEGQNTALRVGGLLVDMLTEGISIDHRVEVLEHQGSGGGIDLTAMWQALATPGNEQIDVSHLVDAMSGGIVTQQWVEQNFISKQFFNRLFEARDANDATIAPNNTSTTIGSIKALVGLWTEQYLSALGNNPGGGGGGGGATLLSELWDVQLSSPQNNQFLKFNGQKWVNAYLPDTGVTSVGMTVPTGLSVTPATITSTGTFDITFASGYSIPTNQKQGEWDTAYVNTHTHSNKSILDLINATEFNHWGTAYNWVNTNGANVAMKDDVYSKTEADDKFLTISFFRSLFRAYDSANTPNEIIPNAGDTTAITNIKAMFGFWTEQYLSALGHNSSGGGGGGSSTLAGLNDVQIGTLNTNDVLTYDGAGHWVNTPKNTLLSGYATQSWVTGQGYTTNTGTVTAITAGTGLTGGTITNSGTIAISSTYQSYISHGETAYGWGDHAQAGYLTAETDPTVPAWAKAASKPSYTFNELTSHPTTLNGYGITDAIGSGTTFWGRTVSNGVVNGSIDAGSNGGQLTGFHFIELNNYGTLSGYGGYIDFHFNGSSSDYTSRIIEEANGRLAMNNFFKVTSNSVIIGGIVITVDNNGLHVNNAGLYTDTYVSALGVGSGSGGSVENLNITDTLSFSSDSEIFQDGDGQLWIYGSENIIMGNDVHMEGYNFYTDGGTIDADAGYMKAARFYVGTNRYIYLDGTTLKYNDNGTVKTIVLS